MKQIFKLIAAVLLVAVFPAIQVNAESKDEITLTVSSDGPTKDDALKNALRTAIEQAYGAFVSANTTILNDELVKDEIVTVSNGSIKEYKEISSFEKPDGSGYGMTVNATVSLPHLITYAKNHGSECEFAGNTFGMDLKLFNLQKENELKALYNMIPVVEELCKTTMHWKLEVGEPFIPEIETGNFTVKLSHPHNYQYFDTQEIYVRFLTENMVESFRTSPESYCVMELKIKYLRNNQHNEIYNYIYKTLTDISMPYKTWSKYHDMGMKPSTCQWKWGHHNEVYRYFYGEDPWKGEILYYLRNNNEEIDKWVKILQDKIDSVRLNITIKDNMNEISDGSFYQLNKFFHRTNLKDFENFKIGSVFNGDASTNYYSIPNVVKRFMSCAHGICGFGGSGIFTGLFFSDFGRESIEVKDDSDFLMRCYVFLPISEISKYSSFKVVAKD